MNEICEQKISTKGQIVLGQKVRRLAKVSPGDFLQQFVTPTGDILLRKARQGPAVSLTTRLHRLRGIKLRTEHFGASPRT